MKRSYNESLVPPIKLGAGCATRLHAGPPIKIGAGCAGHMMPYLLGAVQTLSLADWSGVLIRTSRQLVLACGAGDKTHHGVFQGHNTDIGRGVCKEGRNARCENHPLLVLRRDQVIPRRADYRNDANK